MHTLHTHQLFTTLCFAVFTAVVHAESTTFTYQGYLADNQAPATGAFDLEFRLFDAAVGGTPLDVIVAAEGVEVNQGLFAVPLDFGAVFDGSDLYLEIRVRPGGSLGGYATLVPRQPVTAAPQALFALQAAGVPPGAITGVMLNDGAVTAAKIAAGAVSSLGTPNGSDPAAVFVDDNGRVGMGTDRPTAGLDIAGGRPIQDLGLLAVRVDEADGLTNLDGAFGLAAEGDLLAVSGTIDSGVTLLNIADPAVPLLWSQIKDGEGVFTNLSGAAGLALSGTLLAVAAASDNAVTLINVSVPAAPTRYSVLRDGVNGLNELGGVRNVAVEGTLMAIAAQADNAVTLVDLSNPASPILKSVMKDGAFGFDELGGAFHLTLANNLLAIAAELDNAVTLVDVSTPTSPLLIAVMKDGVNGFDELRSVQHVAVAGNLLAIAAAADDAVTLVDITNPSTPVLRSVIKDGVGGFDYVNGTASLALNGTTLAFAARFEDAVTLVDVSALAAPQLLGVARNHQAGLHFLQVPLGILIHGGDLIVAGAESDAVSIVRPVAKELGLVTSGWVGIGTPQPLAPLHVLGNLIVDGAEEVNLETTHFSAGSNTIASGLHSVAMGFNAKASGDYTTAMGSNSVASGNFSSAMGHDVVAGGEYSMAMGFNSEAAGDYSTALGYQNIAGGLSSTALGGGTHADGKYSTALGAGSAASGDYSIAMGFQSEANGDFSTAIGQRAIANHDGSFVWTDSLIPIPTTLFTSTGPRQFLIRAAGGVGINENQPQAPLHVDGGSDADLTAGAAKSGFLVLGDVLSYNIVMDNNEIMARNSTQASPLFLNAEGGSVIVGGQAGSSFQFLVNGTAAKPGGGSWSNASDRRLKHVGQSFTRGLEALEKIQPTHYHYAEDNALDLPSDREYVGLVAQDVAAAVPEAIEPNDTGYLHVNNDPILWTMLNGIKELNRKLEEQRSENVELRTRLEQLEQRTNPGRLSRNER